MRRTALLIPVVCLALDQIFKYILIQKSLLSQGEILHFLFISITPFQNKGAVFSIPLSQHIIIISSFIIIAGLLMYLIKNKTKFSFLQIFSFAFIISGALSNLFDRIFYKGVIDYLSVWPHGFFNIADLMIGAGIIMMFYASRCSQNS